MRLRRAQITTNGREHLALKAAAVIGVIVLAVWLPYAVPSYRVFQFSLVLVYAVAVLGLNLLTGYNGQISLGHSFFFAMGAYASAILMQDHGWPYLTTLPVAFALTFVLGFLFGLPALRLEGLYLALVTLALAVVVVPFLKRFDTITGGSQGIVVTKPAAPSWVDLRDDQWQYFVCLVIGVVMFVIARNLVNGRVGRAVVAIRDNELAAETMGVRLSIFKSLTFAYSAAFAGVAGGLYTFVVGYVSPDSFNVVLAISLLAAMVVGGLATIGGAVFGALFIEFVPVYAQDISDALAGVIYGAALIAVMFLMPGGVMGLLRRVWGLVVDMRPAAVGEAGPGARPSAGEPDEHLVTLRRDGGPEQPARGSERELETRERG